MFVEAQMVPDVPLSVLLGGAALVIAVLFLFVVVLVVVLRGRAKRLEPPPVYLRINVGDLPRGGPPEEGPRLEIYGTPVRLAALVLAPAGRNSELPAGSALSDAIDCLVPELISVVGAHQPLFRRWPFQLSTQGFTHTFFNNVPLPGDHGKGTPWCCVAGRFEAGDQHFLAGLVCTAGKRNSLAQITIQHVGQWMDVVRVKN